MQRICGFRLPTVTKREVRIYDDFSCKGRYTHINYTLSGCEEDHLSGCESECPTGR